jgi:hypothetical protein
LKFWSNSVAQQFGIQKYSCKTSFNLILKEFDWKILRGAALEYKSAFSGD